MSDFRAFNSQKRRAGAFPAPQTMDSKSQKIKSLNIKGLRKGPIQFPHPAPENALFCLLGAKKGVFRSLPDAKFT